MGRLIIVSNRLPVTVSKQRKNGPLTYTRSVGGLSTGLASFYKDYNSLWVGWPGIALDHLSDKDIEKIEHHLHRESCVPVFLTQSEVDSYYHGFSNNVLWPLFHYFPSYVVNKKSYWKGYQKVNAKFAEIVNSIAEDDDLIWVHDYQLLLLPAILRSRNPQAGIGFFLHIPFPSFEIFRMLPYREEILRGMIGANLLGFHTYDYVRYFLESVRRVLGFDSEMGFIYSNRHEDHVVKADMFPIGIDYKRFSIPDDALKDEIEEILYRVKGCRIVLSVDRLDYTKGILNKLSAFDRFLERNPGYWGKVVLILLVVPSRTNVEHYKSLKKEIDEVVGNINGKRATFDWLPVHYLYRSVPFKRLLALYRVSDIALITPVRDGMNLVAKEFLASKPDLGGVLILSEMAGAAEELGESLLVNPNDTAEIASAIEKALKMPYVEKQRRNKIMIERIKRYNIVRWAKDFIGSLMDIVNMQKKLFVRIVNEAVKEQMLSAFKRATKRLFLLDYDGTLIDFVEKPDQAKPDDELKELLRRLNSCDGCSVVIVSGRDKATLEDWFSDLDVALVAEHGVWVKKPGEQWKQTELMETATWKEEIRPILEVYVDRTPGSFIEEKEFSLVWHYRKVDSQLAEIRAVELKETLLSYASSFKLEVMDGNRVLEIKDINVNKGKAVMEWLKDVKEGDFIFAAGDDFTDENIFNVLPEYAYSVKVGLGHSRARYNVLTVKELRNLLKMFVGG